MRQIKFRAWDKETKRMRYLGNDTHDSIMFGNLKDKNIAVYFNLQNGSGGDEYELMQYTGLKDKNGKEIYEGDVVEQSGVDRYEIVWGIDTGPLTPRDNSYPAFHLEPCVCEGVDSNCLSALLDELEVIGNIYENPLLVKDKQ